MGGGGAGGQQKCLFLIRWCGIPWSCRARLSVRERGDARSVWTAGCIILYTIKIGWGDSDEVMGFRQGLSFD